MQNKEIRLAIKQSGLHYWQVADSLHVADTTFTKWLRKELDPKKKAEVLTAIERIKNGGDEND